MAKEIIMVQYNETYKEKWDKFVLTESINGTFLQTMNFYEYHPKDRFIDNSLLFLNGTTIIAVLPACIRERENRVLYSHPGSTFGGLIIGKKFNKISYLDILFEKLHEYLRNNSFDKIILKQPGTIYQNSESQLLDYYLFMNGYSDSSEVGYYIDFDTYGEDIISNFTASRRRDYRYSLKNNFEFRELQSETEINEFYNILCDNYNKFGKNPVHTIDELLDFKFSRLSNMTNFFGVYYEKKMIAGGMVFTFGQEIFHTQYLAVLQEKKDMFANEFLYVNLISTAKEKEYKMLSFGTATLEDGKILNRPLAMYKEGFGTLEYVNKTYFKYIEKKREMLEGLDGVNEEN